jgi:hypothetical protein
MPFEPFLFGIVFAFFHMGTHGIRLSLAKRSYLFGLRCRVVHPHLW